MWLAAGAVLLSLAGLACGSQPQGSVAPVTVSDSDSGNSIELQQGQELIIRLPSNPSTGYTWSQADATSVPLKVQGSPYYETDKSSGNPPPPGAGGTEVWTYTAASTGQQNLRFEYRRSWETGIPPEKVVTYSISVR
jgi:inhibitor of cysteine peptidase